MEKFNKIKVLRISEMQYNTLVKMKSYNVDIANFIRTAIKEKINRDFSNLKPKKEKIETPF